MVAACSVALLLLQMGSQRSAPGADHTTGTSPHCCCWFRSCAYEGVRGHRGGPAVQAGTRAGRFGAGARPLCFRQAQLSTSPLCLRTPSDCIMSCAAVACMYVCVAWIEAISMHALVFAGSRWCTHARTRARMCVATHRRSSWLEGDHRWDARWQPWLQHCPPRLPRARAPLAAAPQQAALPSRPRMLCTSILLRAPLGHR